MNKIDQYLVKLTELKDIDQIIFEDECLQLTEELDLLWNSLSQNEIHEIHEKFSTS